MLHLVFQASLDETLIARIGFGNDVVFLENATLSLSAKGRFAEQLSQLTEQNQLFVLSNALDTRGIDTAELVAGIRVIDYPDLVDLTVKHPQIQSWS